VHELAVRVVRLGVRSRRLVHELAVRVVRLGVRSRRP
jgi:hypothetical protein